MADRGEKLFKKGYTDFDAQLDRELEEEKEERRRQLLLQAPDYKLMNYMAENGTDTPELATRLKDAGFYYLRCKNDDETEKLMGVFRKTLLGHPSLREDILKQMGYLGCLAFKQALPVLGKGCAEIILEDLRLLGKEAPEVSGEGYLHLRNVADTAARTRNDKELREIATAFYDYWKESRPRVTNGLLSALSDLLFVAADRRQIDTLIVVCRLCRSILRHASADSVMRQQFVAEWGGIAAQIGQRGWVTECTVLLKELCILLGSVKDFALIKKVLADVAVHMQMQSKWDGFESAFRLYYPCQLFVLEALVWMLRKYRRIIWKEDMLETKTAQKDSGMLAQLEQKMNLITEREQVTDMIRFLLRNARDLAAACARLEMKDEWEIYLAWQRVWLSACGRSEKRKRQVRRFMQFVAEYWHSTQPSRSRKQWELMQELMQPLQLSREDQELVNLLA